MKLILERIYQKFLLVAAGGGLVTVALAGGPESHRVSIENFRDSAVYDSVVVKPHSQMELMLAPVPSKHLPNPRI